MNGVGVAIAALAQPVNQAPLLPTPDEPVGNAKSIAGRPPPPLPANEGRIVGGISSGRHRVLVKTKSDNKLLSSNSRGNPNESPSLGRVSTARCRTPICTECAVPLDLPGYVSNCGSCADSRTNYNIQGGETEIQNHVFLERRRSKIAFESFTGTGELFKQHSRSNETLPTPPSIPSFAREIVASSRRVISRSENQLNSLGFQPFLDAEGCDHGTPVAAYSAAGQKEEAEAELEPAAPPSKLHRGGSGHKTNAAKGHRAGSMRSNSQESECSHPSRSSHTPSLTSLSSIDGDPDTGGSTRSSAADVESVGGDPSAGGIIQVYAAYESGLANGTSVKLHVTARTVAREVVDLVVRQLNMAVVLKGK